MDEKLNIIFFLSIKIMSQLVTAKNKETIIPLELIVKIMYGMGGLQHPLTILYKKTILEHNSKTDCCWYCGTKNNSLKKCQVSYIQHQDITPWMKILLENKNDKIYLCWDCAH